MLDEYPPAVLFALKVGFPDSLKPLIDFTCVCLYNLPKLLLFISFPLGVEYFTYFIFLSIILFLRGFSTCIILPVWHMQQNLYEELKL